MDSRTISRALVVLASLAFAPAAQAAPSVAPTSHNFGSQAVGTVGASQGFTVTNDDLTPLSVTGVTFGGHDDFIVSSSTCGFTLAQNDQCEIRVRFAPQGTEARSGTMDVLLSVGNPDPVTLSGTGTALPQGPQGPQGDKGDKGDKGDPCLATDPACRGPKGDPGADGADGVTGSIGPKGDKGDKGDPCPPTEPACRGPKGDKGDTGAQGVQGKIGPPCPATNPACRGPRGLRGATGRQGPPGRDAIIACEVAKTRKGSKPKVICTVRFANAR